VTAIAAARAAGDGLFRRICSHRSLIGSLGELSAGRSRRLAAIVSKSTVEYPRKAQEIDEARDPWHTALDRDLARTLQFAQALSPLLTRQCHLASTLAVQRRPLPTIPDCRTRARPVER
jgi:hypothetical protein